MPWKSGERWKDPRARKEVGGQRATNSFGQWQMDLTMDDAFQRLNVSARVQIRLFVSAAGSISNFLFRLPFSLSLSLSLSILLSGHGHPWTRLSDPITRVIYYRSPRENSIARRQWKRRLIIMWLAREREKRREEKREREREREREQGTDGETRRGRWETIDVCTRVSAATVSIYSIAGKSWIYMSMFGKEQFARNNLDIKLLLAVRLRNSCSAQNCPSVG